MKAYIKGKMSSYEYKRFREIGANYHKFLYTRHKLRINTKRLYR